MHAACDNSAVGFQADSVVSGSSNSNDIRPSINIQLILSIIAYSSHSSILKQRNGMIRACGNLNNILPAGHIALAIHIVARGINRSVSLKAKRVAVARGNAALWCFLIDCRHQKNALFELSDILFIKCFFDAGRNLLVLFAGQIHYYILDAVRCIRNFR